MTDRTRAKEYIFFVSSIVCVVLANIAAFNGNLFAGLLLVAEGWIAIRLAKIYAAD